MNMQFSAHIRCIFAYLGLFATGMREAISQYAWLEASRAAQAGGDGGGWVGHGPDADRATQGRLQGRRALISFGGVP